jgi:hypothetical protein
LLNAVALLAIVLALAPASSGQPIDESKIGKVLVVDNRHPKAADSNPGTEQLPLKSITQATRLALDSKRANVGTKVLIRAGTYRESIVLDGASIKTDAPLVFEAATGTVGSMPIAPSKLAFDPAPANLSGAKGSVTVSGSDVWTGWRRENGANVFSHPWPFKWGLAPIPSGWPAAQLQPIVRRREMIFVDNRPLEQVLSMADLKDGSFYVDEEKAAVFIRLLPGATIESSLVEVATRAVLFDVKGLKNIVLRGITFQHDGSPLPGVAVAFNGTTNVLVEDCAFVWNNWGGLGFSVVSDFAARRNIANHNGGSGTLAWRVKRLSFEDNETSYNNWRGTRGGFNGWSVAGSKHLRVHDGRYVNLRAVGNYSRGLWLDFDNANIVVEKAQLCDNLLDGIFIEMSQGPVTVKDSLICRSQTASGILGSSASRVTIENTTLYGNKRAQIRLSGRAESPATNWETKEPMVLKTALWTIKDSVIVADDPKQLLVETVGWAHFTDSLKSDKNLWYSPGSGQSFKIDSTATAFSHWQSTTNGDIRSIFADPLFKDPKNPQSGVLRNSPIFRK